MEHATTQLTDSEVMNEDRMVVDSPVHSNADDPLKEEPWLAENVTREKSRPPLSKAAAEPPPRPPKDLLDASQDVGLEENDKLKDELILEFRKNQQLVKINEEQRKQLEAAGLEIQTLKKPASQERHNHDAQIYRLKDDQANSRQDLRSLKADLERTEQREKTAQEGIHYLKAQNQELTGKLRAFQTEVKRTQEKSIREMTDARWAPIPDDFHREHLKNLHHDIRDWAKTWAASSLKLDTLPPETRRDFIQKYLPRVCQLTQDGKLPPELSSPRSKMKEKAPWLLLNALLAYEVQTQVFAKAFFCFDTARGPALEKTHNELLEANPRETHVWRSTMWRIMNPPKSKYRTQKDEDVAKKTLALTRNLCNYLAAEFKKSLAQVLFQPLELKDKASIEDRSKELREIFMKATDIATELWTQRPNLYQHGLDEIRHQRQTFSISSATIEAHPLSKVNYDDPSHNGRRIGIVVRPALLAECEDEGEDSDGKAFRVLAKAVVWLEDANV